MTTAVGEWLSPAEFAMFRELTENEGMWMPHTRLYAASSGGQRGGFGMAIHTHLYNLRRKLSEYGLDGWVVTSKKHRSYSWRNPRWRYPDAVYVDLLTWGWPR